MKNQTKKELLMWMLYLFGVFIGVLLSLIVVVAGYPLQLYPNGSYAEVGGSMNETPLVMYAYNGSIYLVPANITYVYYPYPTNVTNISYFNVTTYNVTNVTNTTCINCSYYNVTNVTQVNNLDSGKVTSLESRVLNLENSQTDINKKWNNITTNGTLNTEYKWEQKDSYFSAGIICAILLGMIAIGMIIRSNQ